MMTREEAIEVLENGGWWDLLIPVTTIEGRIEDDKLHEALDLAIAALRPVNREKVEKVWRGEWIECQTAFGEKYNKWSRCGFTPSFGYPAFCASCGSANTGEAVEMVMERMEALQDGTDD